MTLYYADTSAVIKLLAQEEHSRAFADFYDTETDAEWVSSALLRIELTRVVLRAMPTLLPACASWRSPFLTLRSMTTWWRGQ